MATLKWRRSSGGEQLIQLGAGDVSIGREPGNTVRVDSTYVSKRHAVLRATPGGYVIADLGSSNGTIVNGAVVTQSVLKSGDTIEIGQEKLEFSTDDAVAAAQPVRRGAPRGLVIVGSAAALVIGLIAVLVVIGGRSAPSSTSPSRPPTDQPADPQMRPAVPEPAPAVVPSAPAPAPARAPASEPVAVPVPPPTSPPAPGSASISPEADAGALYDSAIAHIKGGRLVEARRLLAASLKRDPGSLPARERLRQVEAAIQIEINRRLTAGQRAFTYLKYQDAIVEWEQVVSMAAPSDPRRAEAADGIQRARARLEAR